LQQLRDESGEKSEKLEPMPVLKPTKRVIKLEKLTVEETDFEVTHEPR
jgi:hypothetical protein